MDIRWRKSSFSEMGDNCLELAVCRGGILVRESDDPGMVVRTAPGALRALLAAAEAGVFGGSAR